MHSGGLDLKMFLSQGEKLFILVHFGGLNINEEIRKS